MNKTEQLINNIYYLSKKKGIKIGELEEKVGVSTGYISKIKKRAEDTNPSFELIASIASVLDVSMDTLRSADLQAITPTEDYLLRVINKLLNQTLCEDKEWIEIPFSELENVNANGEATFIMCDLDTDTGSAKYTSKFFPYSDASFAGSGYRTQMPEHAEVFILSTYVSDPFSDTGQSLYELYFINSRKLKPLCHSGQSLFADKLKELYKGITESCRHVKLGEEVRSSLDVFLDN